VKEVNYPELMRILSRPRPAGSRAERDTVEALLGWLQEHGLPQRLQPFTLYPYFFICTGLWMIAAHSLLAAAVWLRWGWTTSLISACAVLGGLVDTAFDIPLVTWPGRRRGQNMLVEFEPEKPARQLVISAHYDSKTELFDHHTRAFFVRNLRIGILLALILGMLAPLEGSLDAAWAGPVHFFSILLTQPLLFLAWGLGLNLSMGRLRREHSQGAVDNGAACAILLGLAQRMAEAGPRLQHTRLTLALFGGEEVNMQGSRAFARSLDRQLPVSALNLEIMAQDGEYVTREQDGMALRLLPTDAGLNQAIARAVKKVSGQAPRPAGPINSDGYSFMRTGIPVTTLGTYDRQQQSHGFHLPGDNLARVRMDRLPEAVKILGEFIQEFDKP